MNEELPKDLFTKTEDNSGTKRTIAESTGRQGYDRGRVVGEHFGSERTLHYMFIHLKESNPKFMRAVVQFYYRDDLIDPDAEKKIEAEVQRRLNNMLKLVSQS